MNQTGRSMIAIAVTRVLRKYEDSGHIRAGCGRRGDRPNWAAGWVPGMDDTGGLGPIPQGTIDAIAEEVARNIETQLDAAQGKTPEAPPEKPKKRERPDWLIVVGGDKQGEDDADDVRSGEGIFGDEGEGSGTAGRDSDGVAAEAAANGDSGQADPPEQ